MDHPLNNKKLQLIEIEINLLMNEIKNTNFIDPNININYTLKPWLYLKDKHIQSDKYLVAGVLLIALHKIIELHEWDNIKKKELQNNEIASSVRGFISSDSLQNMIITLIFKITTFEKHETLFPKINDYVFQIIDELRNRDFFKRTSIAN